MTVDLDQFDVDGAVREAAEKASRRAFLRRGAVGGGALLGASALLPAVAEASSNGGDVAILNFALTLEYLESTFYVRAVDMHALRGETLRFAKTVRDHELAHVAAIKATILKLGGKPVAKPKFDFKGIPSNPAKFRATAIALEDTGVAAYAGQVGNIKNPAVLAAAASIHSVEARHAAWMRNIVGEAPAPAAFDPAYTKAKVLKIVASTGFIV
jgi:Ferritin-like domain